MMFGTEQEYGILLTSPEGREVPHPMYLADAVIRAYRDPVCPRHVDFSFAGESPLTDQWGFHVPMAEATPELLTHVDPMANRVLSNGARFYVDHAHPEFAAPETMSVREAVLFDRVGDVIMHAGAVAASERFEAPVKIYKNNTDGKGASYGSHENYLLARDVVFDDIVAVLTPFLVSRIVFTGSGRVGIGTHSESSGFQLSSRADFFERRVGLETTVRRPIINTRDEPHANAQAWRRLHIITGDANIAQLGCMLKIGTTALVLAALERGIELPRFDLADPVSAFHAISHDLRMATPIRLTDGTRVTAVDMQLAYAEACASILPELSPEYADVHEGWIATLDGLRRDPAEVADTVDWVAKLTLLEAYRDKESLLWDAPRLAAIDLQYHDVDPQTSLALALERAGRLATVWSGKDITQAMTTPPADTRAGLRGRLVREFGEQLVALGWQDGYLRHAGGVRHIQLGDPQGMSQRTADALVTELLALG